MNRIFKNMILPIVLMLACCAVMAQEKQKVAVYVDGKDAAEGVAYFLGSKMVIAITETGNYTAVERTNDFLTQLSKSANYERSGAVDATSIAQIGKQSNVDLVCAVLVKNVLGEKYVSARLIKVESAEVINSADGSKNYTSVADLTELAQDITKNLFKSTVNTANNGNMEYALCGGCGANGEDLYTTKADEPGKYTWTQAKGRCSQKGNGWYLPSKEELNSMYNQKEEIGGFSGNYYWGSTEYSSSNAWSQYFANGSQHNDYKSDSDRVRCVRRVN